VGCTVFLEDVGVVDVRKSLQVLHEEWSSCTACELGKRRVSVNGAFVAGEGVRRGVMFIGEGPGVTEEEEGRPFVGKSGGLLRDLLNKLQFTDFYITNLVTCRACEPRLDDAGQQIFKKRRNAPDIPLYKDKVPLPTQIEACRPRLHEEIYIVDPILIVTLGATAAEHVLGRSVAITKERGRTQHATIPGGTLRPVLTDKKQVWGRKVHGQYVLPTETNEVQYLVLPTVHPAYVLRKIGDRGADSPLRQFADDLRLAVKTYERYLVEALGVEPTSTSDADLSDVGGEYDGEEGS